MNSLKVVLVIFIWTTIHGIASCQSTATASHWFNLNYLECMNNYLPCECEKSIESYFSLTLDTTDMNKLGVSLIKSGEMEPNYYRILRSTYSYEYDIKGRNDELLAKLSFVNDTLILNEHGVIMQFVRSKSADTIRPALVENIRLLNKAMLQRDYSTLEEILKEDSLRCECNKWLGNLNLISVKGKPDSWVLKMSDGILSIYEMAQRMDPDDSVELQKLSSYKWNNE